MMMVILAMLILILMIKQSQNYEDETMLSCSLTLEPVARHRESDLVKEWQERPAEL